jgi:hypothetical protein
VLAPYMDAPTTRREAQRQQQRLNNHGEPSSTNVTSYLSPDDDGRRGTLT